MCPWKTCQYEQLLPSPCISSVTTIIRELAFLPHWAYSFTGLGSSQGPLLFAFKSCWKLSLSENIAFSWWLAISNVYHSSQPLFLRFAPLYCHHTTFAPTFNQHCTSAQRTHDSCTTQSHIPTFAYCRNQKRHKLRQNSRCSHAHLHTSIFPLKASLGSDPGASRPFSPQTSLSSHTTYQNILFFLPVTV